MSRFVAWAAYLAFAFLQTSAAGRAGDGAAAVLLLGAATLPAACAVLVAAPRSVRETVWTVAPPEAVRVLVLLVRGVVTGGEPVVALAGTALTGILAVVSTVTALLALRHVHGSPWSAAGESWHG